MDRAVILELRDVAYRYPRAAAPAVQDISLEVRGGDFTAVLGPNGSGKTTLMRLALGVVTPDAGTARVLERRAHEWSRRDLARRVAVMPQREDNLFPQRVRETVLLGRYPHLSLWGTAGDADRAAVDRALVRCDVEQLADRSIWSLSGGEYQRVRLARALAQEPSLLVLDEPTSSLDVRHEMELFELLRALVDSQGLAVLFITHEVNLAARYADRVVLLAAGRAAATGSPEQVLTAERLEAVFQWPIRIERIDGRPQMVPLRAPSPLAKDR